MNKNSLALASLRSSLLEARAGLDALIQNEDTLQRIAKAGALIIETARNRGRIFSCGNGGSMCDAMHFAEELTGRYRSDRPAIAATAISDPSHLTCVGNDMGFDLVFSRYLEAHGRPGDILLAISTSGTSANVLRAAETAKRLGMVIVALTGKPQCKLGDFADVHIATPAGSWADRVQELHIKVIHSLIDMIESGLFSKS